MSAAPFVFDPWGKEPPPHEVVDHPLVTFDAKRSRTVDSCVWRTA
jgi:hypothetical protein